MDKVKAYTVGQILLDKDGMWHVHFLGEHLTPQGIVFGPGSKRSKSLAELFKVVRLSLNRSKRIYMENIADLEAMPAEEPKTEEPPKTE
jgi:hypothetical protein